MNDYTLLQEYIDKAERAKRNYTRLNNKIIEAERLICDSRGLSEKDFEYRLKESKEKNLQLQGFMDDYNFAHKEIVRLSAQIQAEAAYLQIREIQKQQTYERLRNHAPVQIPHQDQGHRIQ